MNVQTDTNSNGKTILGVIILIAVIVGIFMFLLPKKDEFNTNNTKAIQQQIELTSLKTQLSKIESLESEFSGGEVTKKDFLYLIPEEVEQDQVIESLAQISDENKVAINSMSFGLGLEPDAGINMLNITLNISGAHQNLISFIEGLEDGGRKFKVETLSVQILENRLENMSINIKSYFL
jgi:Tfp pilus assembly protein PilO